MSQSTGFWSAFKRALAVLLGGPIDPKRAVIVVAPVPAACQVPTAVAAAPMTATSDAAAALFPAEASRAPAASSRPLAGMLAVTARLNPRKTKRPARKRAGARTANKPVKSTARSVKRSAERPVWIGAELRQRTAAAKSSTVVVPFRPRPKPAGAVKGSSGGIRRAA